jgi:GNAT superfamily N-acetyltransferase
VTTIDLANSSDLAKILKWLEKEMEDGSGFYCNRGSLNNSLNEGKLFVCRVGNDVPAFLAHGICLEGILSVRKNRRGCGFGGALARYGIEREIQAGVCILDIECAPPTSIPFWRRFGFTMYPNSTFGYRFIEKSLRIPKGSSPVDAVIKLYSADRFYSNGTPNHQIFPRSSQQANSLHFGERIILSQRPPIASNIHARVFVNDRLVFEDQLAHRDAEERGIKRDLRSNFFVEKLAIGTHC